MEDESLPLFYGSLGFQAQVSNARSAISNNTFDS